MSVLPRKRGRPSGRVVGSWRARAEAAGVPTATFRREALADALLARCPFMRAWTRNSVYRAAEGLHRTPTRYHAELIERAKKTSERVDGVNVPGGDGPEERRRRGWTLRDMKDRAHEDAASVLARAWDVPPSARSARRLTYRTPPRTRPWSWERRPERLG